MRTLPLRKAALVAALPLALSSLAACGSDSSRTTATDPLAGPSSSSPATPSSSPSRTSKPVDSATFLAMVQAATHKITTARFSMTMDVSGQSVPVTGVIDMTGDTPAMQMMIDTTGMGTPTQMRMVDKVIYFEVPGTTGRFYKIDLNDPNGPLSSLGGGAFDSIDPNSMMSQVSPKVFKKVTDRGTVTVKGQELHHYSVLMDLRHAARLKGVPSSAAMPKAATYDVWLDSEGRMVRFSMLMKNAFRMTATYSAFGSPAHVVAPPAADVVAMPGTTTTG